MRLEERVSAYKALAEKELDAFLWPVGTRPVRLHEAIRYSTFAGGKRLRPVLAMMAAEAFGASVPVAASVCAAIELVHTYSLIHDDLPCMDDDDLRRGMPTCHKKYGEAMAVLAGDALMTEAFRMITTNGLRHGLPAECIVTLIQDLCEALGPVGVVAGQVEDLEAEGRQIALEDLEYIHRHKTGDLVRVCLRSGARIAGADAEGLALMDRFGALFGQVFQITDDILDVEGSEDELGKPVGSDERNVKATYPALTSLAHAKAEARRLASQAAALVRTIGTAAEPLAELVLSLPERRS